MTTENMNSFIGHSVVLQYRTDGIVTFLNIRHPRFNMCSLIAVLHLNKLCVLFVSELAV